MMRVKPKSGTTVYASNLQPIEEDNKMYKRNVLSQKLSIFGTSRGGGGTRGGVGEGDLATRKRERTMREREERERERE